MAVMMLEFVIIFCGLAGAVASRRVYSFAINPLSILFFGWILVLTGYSLRVFPYPPISLTTATAILLFFLGYSWSCISGALVKKPTPVDPSSLQAVIATARLVSGLCVAIGATAVALSVLIASATVGLEAAFLEGAIRSEREVGQSQTIPASMVYGVYMLLPGLFLRGCFDRLAGKSEALTWIALASGLTFSALTAGRTFLGFCLLNWLLGLVTPTAWTRSASLSKRLLVQIGLLFFVAAVVFASIYVVRGSWLAYLASESADSELESSLQVAYIYLVGSIANLNFFISDYRGDFTWFRAALHPLVVAASKFYVLEPVLKQGFEMDSAAIPGGTNVYSIVRALYMDLGLIGCLLGGVLLGALSHFAFISVASRGAMIAVLLYAYLAVTTLTSWYEYMTYSAAYFYSFVLCYGLYLVARNMVKG